MILTLSYDGAFLSTHFCIPHFYLIKDDSVLDLLLAVVYVYAGEGSRNAGGMKMVILVNEFLPR